MHDKLKSLPLSLLKCFKLLLLILSWCQEKIPRKKAPRERSGIGVG